MTIHEREMCRWLASSLLCWLCASGAAVSGPAIKVSITRGVAYGDPSEMARTMDVYQPAQPEGAGVIFLMSGGWQSLPQYRQWMMEDNGSLRLATDDELRERLPLVMSFSFRPLLERGITVFGVYHRNSPRFRMPDIVADVRRAVGFIGRHAGDYAVDPRRLGLWGVSSGGHLALLIGATDDPGPPAATDALVEPPFRAAAIVAYAPPTDLERVLRGHEPSNPALDLSEAEYQAFSPFRHVSSQAPPTLIVHGEADELVALRESLTLYEALRERGVEARLVTIPGARHGFVGEAAELARREAVAWFERYLGVESR